MSAGIVMERLKSPSGLGEESSFAKLSLPISLPASFVSFPSLPSLLEPGSFSADEPNPKNPATRLPIEALVAGAAAGAAVAVFAPAEEADAAVAG